MSTESETVPLLSSEKGSQAKGPCILWSERWRLAYLSFFGCMAHFSLRVNLSVAIVSMVNSTQTSNSSSSGLNSTSQHGHLSWSGTAQTGLLSAYFYGYIVLQIPGGWLSVRYGPRMVMGLGLLLSGLVTMLTPLLSDYGIIYVYVIRVVAGLCGGVVYPSIFTMWGRWAPPLEASRLLAITGAGCGVGVVVTFALSGILCDSDFLGGWPSVFYVSGLSAVLWAIYWMFFMRNFPSESTSISTSELNYIINSQGSSYEEEKSEIMIPWLSILTSPATWACAICSFCSDWVDYTLLTCLPTFLKDVMKYDIKSNGLLSSVPTIIETLVSVVSSYAVDIIREKKILGNASARKLCQVVGYLGAAGFLFGTGYIPVEKRTLAVLFLSLSIGFNGLSQPGFSANVTDFAPRFAGIIFSLCNVLGTLPGMISPVITGLMTPHRSQDEWKNVFYLGGGFAIFGAIQFAILAKGTIQSWAVPQHELIVKPPTYSKPETFDTNSVNVDERDMLDALYSCDNTIHQLP